MKRNKNFLEFIPEVNDKIEFYEKDDLVYLVKKHNHIFDKIAQKMFFTPKESNIKLEGYGSDVFRMILFLCTEKVNDTENSLFKRFGVVPCGARKKVKKVL